MGMIAYYVSVDNETFEKILEEKLEILDLESDEDTGANVYPTLDIDKSWGAIQFMLCGSAYDGEPPLGYVIPMLSENALDVEPDFDAFYLTQEQVFQAYEQIKDIKEQDFRMKYNFKELVANKIYSVVEDEDPDDFFDYLYDNFEAVKTFFKDVKEADNRIIFYIM